MPNKVRVDKWLWSIRLFKTRTVASEACKSGRIKIDGKSVKPSYMLEVGTTVQLKKRDKLWVVKVLCLIEKRVGAPQARECYEDLSPPQDPLDHHRSFFHTPAEKRDKGTGRPTKRDRRDLEKFKDTD
ncbi:MAG: RNA-binding S4 domain-containing protein [Bacteroidetes bacterium]|nr:RNA-binding S4 domain-containing protein [Bacteroidota bacterium]